MSRVNRQQQAAVPPERVVGRAREDEVVNPNPGNPFVEAHLQRRAVSQAKLYPLRGFGDVLTFKETGGVPGVPLPSPMYEEKPAR